MADEGDVSVELVDVRPQTVTEVATPPAPTLTTRGEQVTTACNEAAEQCLRASGSAVAGCVAGCVGDSPCEVHMHRAAGVIWALGCLVLSSCWMQNSTETMDALMVAMSTTGMVVLNTVSAERLQDRSTDIRRYAVLLVTISYLAVFGQCAYAVIGEKGADCEPRCCRWSELGYGLATVVATTLLFFGGGAFRALWDDSPAYTAPQESVQVAPGYQVLAIFLVVSGMALLVTAGTQDSAAMVVPIPAMVGCLVWLLLVTQTHGGGPVWRAWSRFVPAWTYVFGLAWPILLGRAGYLQGDAQILAFCGMWCIFAGARLGISVWHTVQTPTSSATTYMY